MTTPSNSYPVDVVFCIDATGSMEDPTDKQQRLINMVKKNVLRFYDDVAYRMLRRNKPMAQLRIRVIVFRDFLADGREALITTDFFQLPQQSAELSDFVHSITAAGGGDIPEDGLEALATAMNSDWITGARHKRHIIVVLSDAGTHILGYGKSSPYYPKDMPANLSELEDRWDAMDAYGKRLIIYAPDTNFWNYIGENWEMVYHVKSAAGNGIAEHRYDDVLNMIIRTI